LDLSQPRDRLFALFLKKLINYEKTKH
jgi:hypothetical protein